MSSGDYDGTLRLPSDDDDPIQSGISLESLSVQFIPVVFVKVAHYATHV